MKILAVVGSLRAASFNRKLARAAAAAAPDGVMVEIIDGRDVPHYDQDADGDVKPPAVAALLEKVAGADGLLFVTPEYNYGIPGTLKNLIDWASRPAFRSPLRGRPALVMASSMAPTGGARAHVQLTTVLEACLTPCYVAPSFLVPAVHEKFDESGTLVDEITSKRLGQTMAAFVEWARTIG